MGRNNSQETRQQLIDAAYELFQQKEFDRVTVDEIAAMAGVSRRTFFRYFKSKKNVVFPFTDARLDLFREAIRCQAGGRPATFDDLKAIFSEVVQSWIDNKDRMLTSRRIVSQSSILMAYDHEVNARWEQAIGLELDGAQDDDETATPSLRSRVAAGMLVGTMRPVFLHWYETNGEFDLIGKGQEALSLAANGLSSLDSFLGR